MRSTLFRDSAPVETPASASREGAVQSVIAEVRFEGDGDRPKNVVAKRRSVDSIRCLEGGAQIFNCESIVFQSTDGSRTNILRYGPSCKRARERTNKTDRTVHSLVFNFEDEDSP